MQTEGHTGIEVDRVPNVGDEEEGQIFADAPSLEGRGHMEPTGPRRKGHRDAVGVALALVRTVGGPVPGACAFNRNGRARLSGANSKDNACEEMAVMWPWLSTRGLCAPPGTGNVLLCNVGALTPFVRRTGLKGLTHNMTRYHSSRVSHMCA